MKPLTTQAVEPAISPDSPRSLALSGLVLAATLVVLSPLVSIGAWTWVILGGTGLVRVALGDQMGVRRWWRQGWYGRAFPFIMFGFFLPTGNFNAWYFLALYLLALGHPHARPDAAPQHLLHQAATAAILVLGLEAISATTWVRLSSGSPRWISFGGDPWQEFLQRIGLVVFVTVFISWVRRTAYLSRSLSAARDHALRLKLAPHFIFNTLNTLKAQLERDPREASTTIDRLADLYRQLLERTERATVPLREELAFVEAYLGIEQVRLGGRLRVTIDVPEPLDAQEIPTLGLQTLVENAVKHGIAPREEGGALVIRVRHLAGGMLSVAVENPVAPGSAAARVQGTGTGLETLRARLQSPSALRTEAHDGRFLAEFRVPYVDAPI